MDNDLLLDLRHLDDPEPPSFGALRSEEAVRLAAHHQTRRARLVAGAVLAVTLVAGVGYAVGGDERPAETVDTALPSSPPPDEATTSVPASIAPVDAPPTTATSVPQSPGAVPTAPSPPRTVAPEAPAQGAPPSTGPGAAPSAGPAPTLAPAGPAGQPPEGTGATPAGVRFTLTLDANQVPAGGTVRGVVRFTNSRSTPVTVAGGGCTDALMWRPDLYQEGRPVPGGEPSCLMAISRAVAPGAVHQVEVQLRADPELPPGAYEAYSVITVEEDGVKIGSERVVVTVVRP